MLGNRSVGYQLAGSFLVSMALMAGIAWVSLRSLSSVGGSLKHVHEVALPAVDFLDQADRDLQQLLVAERSLLFTQPGDARRAKYLKEFRDNLRQSSERLAKYGALTDDPEQAAVLGKYAAARRTWEATSQQVIALVEAGDVASRERAIELSTGASATEFEAMREPINQLEDLVGARATEHAESARQSDVRARAWVFGISLCAVLANLALLTLLTRRIARPLRNAARIADAIAEGDLSQQVPANDRARSDEIGQLAESLAGMLDKLNESVRQVTLGASSVAASASQLSASSASLSDGATKQASSVSEVSAAIEQMSTSTQQSADSAQRTEQLAGSAAREAKQGGRQVSEMVSKMNAIAEKISFIEDIARQTNMLALNASIEAARAGHAGKGFAVVASEVQRLAERSAGAATTIRELTRDSVQVAAQAGAAIERIVPDIERTAELVEDIASRAREISRGAEESNSAMQQLDQVVQLNAASSEELNATSEALTHQAQELERVANFFKLREGVRSSLLSERPELPHSPSTPPPPAARKRPRLSLVPRPTKARKPPSRATPLQR